MAGEERRKAVVIGAGPAGLAAAEALASAGLRPLVLEAMPSPARKFLMAGKSGLNLTKNEPAEAFLAVFDAPGLAPSLADFGPEEAMDWAEVLGEALFTGSSGRVFPKAMKASPLLRRWLAWLGDAGTELRTRWRWRGWEDDALVFDTPDGPRRVWANATVLALGGASWPRLGSDGGWAGLLQDVAPFRPSNMGFDCGWSAHFRDRFAGAPVKAAALEFGGRRLRGDFVITATGVEGGAIYALSAPLRDALEAGQAAVTLDLAPDRSAEDLAKRLSAPRGKASRANHLRKRAGIDGVKAGLLRELAPDVPGDPDALATAIKGLELPLARPRPLAEAISSAGGLRFNALDDRLMMRARSGVFAAGEMLDWEAPTGGYLLTACLATGFRAGRAAAEFVSASDD